MPEERRSEYSLKVVSGVRSSWVTEETNAALRSDILRTLLSMK